MFVVILCHVEDVCAVRHKDVATFFVRSHILCFTGLKGAQFFLVIGLYPAGFEHRHILPAALGIIFMLTAVVRRCR